MLTELTERISESSQPGFSEKSSWFSGKKSTRGEYFWKALETNLTKFVAGDETSEESTSIGNIKKPFDVQDPRFGRIASDSSLNRMASMPNLRGDISTPVYGQFPPETMRAPGEHSRYSTAISESRYTPGARYEQAPIAPMQEYERTGNTPGSRLATPDIPNRGYSPYVPSTHPQSQPHSPEQVYSRYTPAPAPALATPLEKEEELEELEGAVVHQGQETDESEKAANKRENEKEGKEEDKEKEKKRKFVHNYMLTCSCRREIGMVWRMV